MLHNVLFLRFVLALVVASLLIDPCKVAAAPFADLEVDIPFSNITERGRFPSPPPGGRLVHIRPCKSRAAVPAFVNAQWAPLRGTSATTSVYIAQHGAGTDFDYYFSSVNKIVGREAAVIAPGFYNTKAGRAPSTWYEPGHTLAWSPEEMTWAAGYDSVSPERSHCSSFSMYDYILNAVTDQKRFPKLRDIYFVGHSGGANMVQHWSIIGKEPAGYRVRYIIANSASVAYFGAARPVDYNAATCPKATQYPYQMSHRNMPPYVSSRFTNADDAFRNWAQRDVVTLVGDFDTVDRFPAGTQSCEAQSQGGPNRRERDYAFWAYRNLKAGTSTDVSSFFGYEKLLSQVKRMEGGGDASGGRHGHGHSQGFGHQNCVVHQVGHVGDDIFNSACGRQALFGQPVTASVGATYI